MNKSHYTLSPNDGHLGKVYDLAVVSSASTNKVVLVSVFIGVKRHLSHSNSNRGKHLM